MHVPDRTRLRGVVREVRADTLVLDVRRSSNGGVQPTGRTEVPRASISNIEMYLRHQAGGNGGSAIGATIGGLAMTPVVLAIGDADIAPQWVAWVTIVVGLVGGAILGHRLLDRDDDPNHVKITVVPGPATP